MASNQPRIIVEGRMAYEDEWTELDDAQSDAHAERIVSDRMRILKTSDKRYKHVPDEENPGQTKVYHNSRLNRLYRIREVR